MRIHARLVMLLLSTFVLIFWGGSAKSVKTPFTCYAGNFMIGQRGSVTCHFGPDIYDSKYDFEIMMLPFNASPNFIGYDIMRCDREDGQPICTTREGFLFNGVLQEHLKIWIPNITRDMEGKYACQLIPADNRKKEFCELTVKETTVEEPNPPTTEMHPVYFPEIGQNQGLLVLAILLGVILFASIVVNIFLLLSNRWLKNIRRHEKADRVFHTSSIPLLRDGEPERIDTTNNESIPLLRVGEPESIDTTNDERPFTMPAIRPHDDNDDEGEENRVVLPPSMLKSRIPLLRDGEPERIDTTNNESIPLLRVGEPESIDTTNDERPFTMPAIRPHDDNDDEGEEHRIVPPPSMLKSRPVTIPGKRPYNDYDDKGKEHRTVPPTPIPFTMPVIRPYNKNDDDEGKEKLIDPPTPPFPIGNTRRPYRRPYHRHA